MAPRKSKATSDSGAEREGSIPDWGKDLLGPGPYRYIVLYGGRGSAKSWTVARALLLRAQREKLRILCVREFQASIRDSSKRLLDDQIIALGLENNFTSTTFNITSTSGSEFIFHGIARDPHKIQSMEGIDIVWIEEGQSISTASWRNLLPTIRKPNSVIIVTFNPRYKQDPTYQMFLTGSEPPRTLLIGVNWNANPWFPDVLREQKDHDYATDPEKAAHIWGGQCMANAHARIFSNWRVEDFESDRDAVRYQGADWGFGSDPCALVQFYVIGPRLYIEYEAGGYGLALPQIAPTFLAVPGSERWPMIGDSSRPEIIRMLKDAGFNIQGSVKGAGSVEDGIDFLRGFEIIVHPRCQQTIDEFSLYSYKVDKSTDLPLPVIEDKHNHYMDALRYGSEGLMRLDRQRKAQEKVAAISMTPVDMSWQ